MEKLITLYLEALESEYDAVIIYKHIWKHEQEMNKKIVLDIANDELHHYEKIMNLLCDSKKEKTILEEAFMENLKTRHEKLKECIEEMGRA